MLCGNVLRHLEVILEDARYTFQARTRASVAPELTGLNRVEHFGVPSFVSVQGRDLQHNGAHSGRLINPPFIGRAGEPRRVVIHVGDIDKDPGKVAFHGDILVPDLGRGEKINMLFIGVLLSCGLK